MFSHTWKWRKVQWISTGGVLVSPVYRSRACITGHLLRSDRFMQNLSDPDEMQGKNSIICRSVASVNKFGMVSDVCQTGTIYTSLLTHALAQDLNGYREISYS